jgi:hypothetical protein
VPFFFKQWGGTRKKVAGRSLDGQTYDELPFRATELTVPPRREKARRVTLARELAGSAA